MSVYSVLFIGLLLLVDTDAISAMGTVVEASMQQPEYSNSAEVEMADGLRSSGKIYIVVATLLSVLLGILAYLLVLDRKIRKMEDEE